MYVASPRIGVVVCGWIGQIQGHLIDGLGWVGGWVRILDGGLSCMTGSGDSGDAWMGTPGWWAVGWIVCWSRTGMELEWA